MITKEMLAKCQNELGQAWTFLPDDVKKAIITNAKHVMFLKNGEWEKCSKFLGEVFFPDAIYKLSPETPVEPEQNWVEEEVRLMGLFLAIELGSMEVRLSMAPSVYKFLGIVYEKDGKETLRTSVDAAFGTPKRVRFLK
jgi:hypothetical protein